MQVGPEYRARDGSTGMQQVMVVVPVDADVHKTQDVADEHRKQRQQLSRAVAMRDLELQHHYGDDDRDHRIAKCLQPSRAHLFLVSCPRSSWCDTSDGINDRVG